jgi:hypothetical protein
MGAVNRTEIQAWASLIALVAIFAWFQSRMMDGWSVVSHPPSALLGIYFAVLVLTTLTETLIAATGVGLGAKRRVARDERDLAIDARASLNERLFIIAAVNVLVWQLMWEVVFPDHSPPLLNVASIPAMFFWLFAILFGGEIVKRLSTVLLYRLQAARG